jgi:hypothetical protein
MLFLKPACASCATGALAGFTLGLKRLVRVNHGALLQVGQPRCVLSLQPQLLPLRHPLTLTPNPATFVTCYIVI